MSVIPSVIGISFTSGERPRFLSELSFLIDTNIAPISLVFCGISGKVIEIDILGDTTIPLVFTDELQTISRTPATPGVYLVNVKGDIDYLTDIDISNQLSIKSIVVKKLTLLETLLANNSALSISAINSAIINTTIVSDFPNLTALGFHGQTPASPPNLGYYKAFKLARNSVSIDVDPQPYNFKAVLTTNTTAGKTINLCFEGIAGKTINIAWGQSTTNTNLVFDGTLQTVAFAYSAIGTKLLNLTGDVDSIITISHAALYATKITEINPKNFTHIKTIRFAGALTLASVNNILTQCVIVEDFPDLAYLDIAGQTPTIEDQSTSFKATRQNIFGYPNGNNDIDFTSISGTKEIYVRVLTQHIDGADDAGTVDLGDGDILTLPNIDNNETILSHIYPSRILYKAGFNIVFCKEFTISCNRITAFTYPPIFNGITTLNLVGCGLSTSTIVSLLNDIYASIIDDELGQYQGLLNINISGQVPEVLIAHADVANILSITGMNLILDWAD